MDSDLQSLNNDEYLQVFQIDKLLFHMVGQLLDRRPADPVEFLKTFLSGESGEELDNETNHSSESIRNSSTAEGVTGPVQPKLSLLHQLISTLKKGCVDFGRTPTNQQIERLGIVIYEAMMGPRRVFHTVQHALDVGTHSALPSSQQHMSPVEVFAGLFHDVVYVQVDRGFPARVESALRPLAVEKAPGSWTISVEAADDPICNMVLSIFNVKPGATITPFTGLNELLSAMVMALETKNILSRKQIAQIAACIFGTIPFRPSTQFEELFQSLASANEDLDIGFSGSKEIEETVHAAIRVANRDVSNFSMTDCAQFLDNTWELLPEGNPVLSQPTTYTIRDFRIAIGKMEGFLSRLPAANVFRCFRGVPDATTLNNIVAAAQNNLTIGVSYLRVKLHTMALFEAIAEVTGGADVPIVLFMGAPPTWAQDSIRIHHFLPEKPEPAADVNPVVDHLLTTGRYKDSSSFDLKTSPVGSFIYRKLGAAETMNQAEKAKLFFNGELNAASFLDSQDPFLVEVVALAASNIVETRREALQQLASKYRARFKAA